MSTPRIPDVLANRYASPRMRELWSPEYKIVLERQLWIAVLKAQRDLGIDVPADAIADYERVVDQVDLASIAERERVTRHDVKARIEEFNALAGHEQIHKGMTSRDLTENVEQLQILRSLEHVHAHGVAVLARIVARAADYSSTVMAGRSHNVAAQATTLGKRFASAADELPGVAAGKVGARRTAIRHEERIADKGCVADTMRHAGRCMPRRMHGHGLDPAYGVAIAIGEQDIELAAVALELGAFVEDLAEDLLHDADILTDANLAAHVEGFAHVLAAVAGLPPVGVTNIGS